MDPAVEQDQARNTHLRAAETHEVAAALHDRAAEFWDARGDSARSERERIRAEHARDGAALERLRGRYYDWPRGGSARGSPLAERNRAGILACGDVAGERGADLPGL